MSADLRQHWTLDPELVFLNHGSFGATPRVVQEAQSEWRARLERQPVQFLARELEGELDAARDVLGGLLGADPDDLAFVPNATHGLNTVLRSLSFAPGDELLATSHGYNAARTAATFVAERAGARLIEAEVPWPLRSSDEVVEAVLRRVTSRTRLLLIDHVTSPTGLRFPVERLIAEMEARGIDVFVDGAHAPGMLELDLGALGATYYTGNCHKWLCAPKGAAFLWVRRDKQPGVRPLAISHGANDPRADRSRFRLELDWTGTADPSPYLCVPAALRFLEGLFPGGLAGLRAHNDALVRAGRRLLLEALGAPAPAPEDMLGWLAAVPLAQLEGPVQNPVGFSDPLQARLVREARIEVPVFRFPGGRVLRISAQAYNDITDYQALVAALVRFGAARA
ncbi:MAG: aminotransferase class V-fold PLP-dependent enzyme [Planctomycetota bacterium]